MSLQDRRLDHYVNARCILQPRSDGASDTQITVHLQTCGIPVHAVFVLGGDYPHSSPEVSIFCSDIPKSKMRSLSTELHRYARDNAGCQVVIEMISLLQEKLSELTIENTVETVHEPSTGDISTLLLHIDHIRSRTRYVKSIRKWTEQLDLKGRLLLCNRLVLLLLQGNSSTLKEYMNRHKSTNIDVDSRGHPCKEKMMSVLCDEILQPRCGFVDFQVVECESMRSLEDLFARNAMSDLFLNYVQTLKGFS